MNAILGFTEILQQEIDDDGQQAHLTSISSSGKTLLSLINDVLDLSRIEANKMELHNEAVHLCDVVNEVKMAFEFRAKEKGVNFRVCIQDGLPDLLILDELRIRQVLFNLIGNAIKFTDRGTVEIVVAYTLEENDVLDLQLSVIDTGIGIAASEQAQIFETFHQQTGQRSEKYGGTGLGLAITKRLVEMMGGNIAVDSQKGRGSAFVVVWPNIAIGKTSDVVSQDDIEDVTFDKVSVLIVDDVKLNRVLLKRFLSAFDIFEAANGLEALESAEKHHPDVILMDMKMPEMDGYEATRQLKANEQLRHIPIIAVTASAFEDDERDIRSMGCDGYIKKPVSKRDLIQTLIQFLPHTKGISEKVEV
jgi:CheY-like chemotaxis protein